MTTKLERLDSEVVYYNFVAEGPIHGRAVLIQEKNFDILLSVARAAAEVFGHEDWVPFCGHILVGDDDDWYAPVLDKIYALEALVAPLLEEVTE